MRRDRVCRFSKRHTRSAGALPDCSDITRIMWLSWTCLAALVITACAMDLRSRCIPNALVVAGLLGGLALQTLAPNGHGLFMSEHSGGLGLLPGMQAAALMLLVTLIAWRAHFFGAGDAKLLIALASYFGPAGVIPLILATLIVGGVQALASLTIANVSSAGGASVALSAFARLPYSVAIGAASIVVAAALSVGLWR